MPGHIRYFNLFSFENIEPVKELSKAVRFTNVTEKEITNLITRHPYFCFVPKEFDYYSDWIFENEHFKEYGFYLNDDEYSDDNILNKKLVPIELLIDQFIFLKLKLPEHPSNNAFIIDERFDTNDIFNYWFKHNYFTDLNQWKDLGLGDKIFNLLPANHNYYDRNIICTCGNSPCNNQEVWYVKYDQGYSIPFIIDLNKRLVFDLHYFDGQSDWQEEDYVEENYKDRSLYSTFPFCFESKEFQVFEKSVFPNNGIVSKYSIST